MPQSHHQLHKPLTVSSSFHANPCPRRKLPVELLHRSRFVHQLVVPRFSGLPVQPRNLLPTRMKITSNKNHKAPSVPLSFGPQPKANTAHVRSLLSYPINPCGFVLGKGGSFLFFTNVLHRYRWAIHGN